MTNRDDAQKAVELGVDAIGLIFYPASQRCVDLSTAREIVQALPPFVTSVAVFVNPEPEFVQQVIDDVAIDVLQFHGDEPPDFCQQFNRPYIKAVRMQASTDLVQSEKHYHQAKALLLDAYVPGHHGGTGMVFDWQQIPMQHLQKPLILAGGLTVDNVQQAIQAVRPYAVDVVTGIESSKGHKDTQKMQQFVSVVSTQPYD